MQHHFEVEEANKYGIEEAILLNHLRFWLDKNKANQKNIHEGYIWTYNSARAFAEIFPYIGDRKIARLLNRLEDLGIVKSGCFNTNTYDHTKWYSIVNEYSFDAQKMVNRDTKDGQSFTDIIPYIKPDLKHIYSLLKNFEPLHPEITSYFLNKYDISKKQLQDRATSMVLYCESKNAKYSNYKATLETWLRKDGVKLKSETNINKL